MASLVQIEERARRHHLTVLGGFMIGPGEESDFAEDDRTLLLFGALEPGFWAHVRTEQAFDGASDPIDRWSERVIEDMANTFDGNAYFPFGGPPHRPFQRWALRSGRCWVSPVGLLVHDTAGLMVSFRGAIAMPQTLALPIPPSRPCDRCVDRPCRHACPVGALTADGYDLRRCHGFLDTGAGTDCMTQGCAVRRACPISQTYARLPEQSAYHMRQFHR